MYLSLENTIFACSLETCVSGTTRSLPSARPIRTTSDVGSMTAPVVCPRVTSSLITTRSTPSARVASRHARAQLQRDAEHLVRAGLVTRSGVGLDLLLEAIARGLVAL